MELFIQLLNKTYGKNHALTNFTYRFTPGVYGLLGPNGAGKSTLMNIITGNLKSDSGTIQLGGTSIMQMGKEYRKLLGFMPQQQSLYSNFTLIRFLYYVAALKGIHKKEAEIQIEELLGLVNLQHVANRKLGAFSGGMKQRALIAQALLGNPPILILDEPTAGLDPKERIRIRNLISEVAFDKIVILATHVVSDIEFIAKEILLLKSGQLVGSGSPYKLCNGIDGNVFEIKTTQEKLLEIETKYRIGNITKDEENIYVRILSDAEPKNYSYQKMKPNLEDLYLYNFDNEKEVSV